MLKEKLKPYFDSIKMIQKRLKDFEINIPNTGDIDARKSVTEKTTNTVTGAAPKIFNINLDKGVNIEQFNNENSSGANSIEDIEQMFIKMLENVLVRTQTSIG